MTQQDALKAAVTLAEAFLDAEDAKAAEARERQTEGPGEAWLVAITHRRLTADRLAIATRIYRETVNR